MASKFLDILKKQKEKEVHIHEPHFNLEARVNANRIHLKTTNPSMKNTTIVQALVYYH